MRTHVKSDASEEDTGHGTAPAVAFASIWAYALAVGFVALGITHGLSAVIPRYLRVPLQWATIATVALLAGLACESVLARAHDRSLHVGRREGGVLSRRSQ